MIKPRAHLQSLAPYPLADKAPGLTSLAQNESAYPPSPKALEAGRSALEQATDYPDLDWSNLRDALATAHGVAASAILCGNGSMELIRALIHAYTGPGDQVLSTAHAYALFRTAAETCGADYRSVAEPDLTVSIDALLDAVTPTTRLVAVANPGNPTGTRIGRADLIALRTGLPDEVLLLIDEAYGEFADGLDAPMFDLVERGDTVVLRTLSKAYGLAGQRIGWGVFPPAIRDEVRKMLIFNNVNQVSLAMATEAVRDQRYMKDIVSQTITERERFATGLRKIGLSPIPSHTNFVLIPFNDADEATAADAALRGEGILVRGMAGYGLPHCLRATIGLRAAMDRALEALTEWKEST